MAATTRRTKPLINKPRLTKSASGSRPVPLYATRTGGALRATDTGNSLWMETLQPTYLLRIEKKYSVSSAASSGRSVQCTAFFVPSTPYMARSVLGRRWRASSGSGGGGGREGEGDGWGKGMVGVRERGKGWRKRGQRMPHRRRGQETVTILTGRAAKLAQAAVGVVAVDLHGQAGAGDELGHHLRVRRHNAFVHLKKLLGVCAIKVERLVVVRGGEKERGWPRG